MPSTLSPLNLDIHPPRQVIGLVPFSRQRKTEDKKGKWFALGRSRSVAKEGLTYGQTCVFTSIIPQGPRNHSVQPPRLLSVSFGLGTKKKNELFNIRYLLAPLKVNVSLRISLSQKNENHQKVTNE